MPQAFYRRNLPHLQKDFRPHFVTFCTYQRAILPPWARWVALQCCLYENERKIELHAAVVMPDHVHVIFTPLIDYEHNEVVPLASIMKSIKGASAHLIRRRMGQPGRVWQIESFDRVLRCSEKLDEKLAYVIANPVRRGLVVRSEEWPWLWVSSKPHRYTPFM